MRDSCRQQLLDAIVDYVRDHPQATDTAEGIRTWWVPDAVLSSEAVLDQVLDALVEEGVLRRERLPGGGELFVVASDLRPRQ